MHIGIPCTLFKDEFSGRSRYLRNVIIQLLEICEKEEHRISLYSDQFYSKLDELKSNAQIVIIPKTSSLDKWDRNFWFSSHIKVLPDIFWQPYFALPNKRLPVPLVVTVHDIIQQKIKASYFWKRFALPFRLYSLDSFRKWITEKRNIKNVAHFVSVSQTVTDDLLHFFNINEKLVTTNYNGVENQFFHQIQKHRQNPVIEKLSSKKYLLFAGGLNYRKNLKRILIQYRNLPSKIKQEYALVIIGEGYWQKRLHLHNPSKLAANEYWFKYLTETEYIDVLQHARGLLYPSIIEGFGLPVIEAYAAGVPVLTSKNSTMEEILCGGDAVFVDPFSNSSIYHGLLELIAKPHNEIAKQNRIAIAKQYSWKTHAQILFDIFQSILE